MGEFPATEQVKYTCRPFYDMTTNSRQHMKVISMKFCVCCLTQFLSSVLQVCSQPISVISYKIGLCVVDPAGKPCLTTFTRLQYRDGVSIVQARPKTGRMHQVPGFITHSQSFTKSLQESVSLQVHACFDQNK